MGMNSCSQWRAELPGCEWEEVLPKTAIPPLGQFSPESQGWQTVEPQRMKLDIELSIPMDTQNHRHKKDYCGTLQFTPTLTSGNLSLPLVIITCLSVSQRLKLLTFLLLLTTPSAPKLSIILFFSNFIWINIINLNPIVLSLLLSWSVMLFLLQSSRRAAVFFPTVLVQSLRTFSSWLLKLATSI